MILTPSAKMKDGRTHVAHKAEHAIDLESGALVAVTLQDADQGDTTTIVETAMSKSRPRPRPPTRKHNCTRSSRTRGTTATRRWSTAVGFGRTSRNPPAAGAIGPPRRTRKRPSIGIAAGAGAPAGDACDGAGQNSPSARLRPISGGCDARICADTRTSEAPADSWWRLHLGLAMRQYLGKPRRFAGPGRGRLHRHVGPLSKGGAMTQDALIRSPLSSLRHRFELLPVAA